MHNGLVCHKKKKKTSAFLFESLGVRNLRFVIISFMFVPFWASLDQVFLGGHLFCLGLLLFFAICILYDDVSD